jgi:predicted ATPase with chaperone activity
MACCALSSIIICLAECGEAAWAGDAEIVSALTLSSVVDHVKRTQPPPVDKLAPPSGGGVDFRDVKG